MIAIYHQTKTPISFWYKWKLNLRSPIQLSDTLPVELTGTHKSSFNLVLEKITFSFATMHDIFYSLVHMRKIVLRPHVLPQFDYMSDCN